ncbi:hypothetical protein GE115_12495 [Agromyces sp. CFH 90414]|uniref:Uncharacterized protein n=1 Tax=Agromyces agglutinans TaxID=2662258 RepID=A0A6I2F8L4_9MICO|nr:hypothetical protein [Agromyces agglutinans]MRG60681.1 hypothetical protein [Agromyces agglutinans]
MTPANESGTGKPLLMRRRAFWATIAVSVAAIVIIPSLLFLGLVHAWAAIATPSPVPVAKDAATPPATSAPTTTSPHPNTTRGEQQVFNDLVDSCMAEKGYPLHLLAAWRAQDFTVPFALVPPEEQPELEYALWGDIAASENTSYEEYVAGGSCEGYALGQLYTWEDH